MTEMEKIYTYVFENEEFLQRYQNCICLYCGKTFIYKKIKEWINDRNGKTAICPFCHVDAVVALEVSNKEDYFKFNEEIQKKIKNKYLGG